MLKAKTWSEPVGKRPFTVRVCERKPGGMIYRVLWDNGKQDWKSLGHRDKDEALAYAHELSAKRRRGLDDIPGERGHARPGVLAVRDGPHARQGR